MPEAWVVAEEIPSTHYMHTYDPLCGFSRDLEETAGVKMGAFACEIRGKLCHLCTQRGAWAQAGGELLQKYVGEPGFGEMVNGRVRRHSEELFANCAKLDGMRGEFLSNAELAEAYALFWEPHRELNVWGMVTNVLEFENNKLTNYMLERIKAACSGVGGRPAEVFSLLTTPVEESVSKREGKELVKLAMALAERPGVVEALSAAPAGREFEVLAEADAGAAALVKGHAAEYGWVSYMYAGPGWDEHYFAATVAGLVKSRASLAGTLRKLEAAPGELAERQRALEQKLSLSPDELRLLRVMRDIVFLKGFRKDAVYRAHCTAEPLMREIAKRLEITLELARTILPPEMKGVLAAGAVDKTGLEARYCHSVIVWEGDAFREIVGLEADAFAEAAEREGAGAGRVDVLNGQCACPGLARGVAKVINVPADMGKMSAGDILFSHMTSPDLVPAMRKASAIVTDMGGITCHAAIVSRELGIPCVIGTRTATKAFRDGDLVDVDATHGVVRRL